jgi:hypothetical protein
MKNFVLAEDKLKATCIWQIATKWEQVCAFLFLMFAYFLCGVFVRFSGRGVEKLFSTRPCQNIFAQQLRGGNYFPVVFPLDFLLPFWPLFPCLESSKTPLKHFTNET